MGDGLLERTRTRWSSTSNTNWRNKSPTGSNFKATVWIREKWRAKPEGNPQSIHRVDSGTHFVVYIILLIRRPVKYFLCLDCWAVDIRFLWPCFSLCSFSLSLGVASFLDGALSLVSLKLEAGAGGAPASSFPVSRCGPSCDKLC